MDRTDTRIRKRLMNEQSLTSPEAPGEIDIARHATLAYSSEDPDHPLEHLIDRHFGRGATRWASARQDAAEHIVLEFDLSQPISRLVYEAEECWQDRAELYRLRSNRTHGNSTLPADLGRHRLGAWRCETNLRQRSVSKGA